MRRFRIIGHRGSGVGADENTLASCRRAIRNGADAVELDVQLIGGKLMLAHPPRKPKESLRMALAGLRCPVVLHLKRRHFNPWHDRNVLERLAKIRFRPGLTVSSRWPGTLTYAKRHFPKLRTAFITEWPGWDLRFAGRLGVSEYHGWHATLTRRAAERAERQNIPLISFVPGGQQAKKLRRLGVSGVIADDVRAFAKP